MPEFLSPETVLQAKKGDSRAIEELVKKFRKPLYFYAVHYLGNEADAEDITQEVLMRVVRALPKFKGEASIGTWIYKIMSNACIDFRRKKGFSQVIYVNKASHEEDAATLELIDPRPQPAQEYDHLELQESIKKALRQLSPEHRATIILHDLHGFKYNEIAEITKASLGTVKSRLFYARQELRKILGPGFERGDL